MTVSGPAVAYLTGGLILVYSGFKGATPSATLKAVLKGNLNPPATLSISWPSSGGAGTSGSGGTTIDGGSAGAGASANQALAKKIAIQKGHSSWTTGQQWTDWVALWNQESGWSATAKNASSGAYGIAQALPPTKYPAAGQESGGSNPGAQISWGIDYIAGRYGSPVMAWAHEQSNNWY